MSEACNGLTHHQHATSGQTTLQPCTCILYRRCDISSVMQSLGMCCSKRAAYWPSGGGGMGGCCLVVAGAGTSASAAFLTSITRGGGDGITAAESTASTAIDTAVARPPGTAVALSAGAIGSDVGVGPAAEAVMAPVDACAAAAAASPPVVAHICDAAASGGAAVSLPPAPDVSAAALVPTAISGMPAAWLLTATC